MLSREARIVLLLVIDVFFFFTELIVGYAVGSLALVADSFHMLNDVLSLVVALYAIKLTKQTHIDSRYSYGWHRAEILAALVNGVFLLALCFSIFLEAIERFFSTPEISNPRLVVVVGSLGLASNIVGLFLFHDHGHEHGHEHGKETPSVSKPPSVHSALEDGQVTPRASHSSPAPRPHSRSRSASYSSLYGHPAATRASIVQAAQDVARARSRSPSRSRVRRSRSRAEHGRPSDVREENGVDDSSAERRITNETTPLLSGDAESESSVPHSLHEDAGHSHGHGGHGHSHGSMNMRALILHVMGDALGNVGVISTGLIIWLTSWSWKYYFDPIISLVITVIIFSSALPLVKSTAFILLQGVPATVSLDETRDAILAVDGVLSVHELHIWQLSENKIVASVHVMASRKHDFMPVAAKIRKALHDRGIHSSTIQPEYHHPRNSPPEEHLRTSAESSCLILCPPDQICDPSENACCPPPPTDA
ncbi:cation efflux protein [Dichomitus squalens LYAD-421 SS1]|uniref:cation efflux protein n=1 Tax=Dichomitus squalens (strain LYAD-421) TaxID=732165 RepID=UPI0004413CB3|nr:cation efflux protein [Dichomitus squalens LYAD-421 SS1]EJF67023.1 cation efflux protein [Dichomitus squalens LYAD-421 SS1]